MAGINLEGVWKDTRFSWHDFLMGRECTGIASTTLERNLSGCVQVCTSITSKKKCERDCTGIAGFTLEREHHESVRGIPRHNFQTTGEVYEEFSDITSE